MWSLLGIVFDTSDALCIIQCVPLIAGFLVFRASDILKKPNIVGEMEKYPGKIGVLYDDLAAGTIGLISALIVNQVMFITL